MSQLEPFFENNGFNYSNDNAESRSITFNGLPFADAGRYIACVYYQDEVQPTPHEGCVVEAIDPMECLELPTGYVSLIHQILNDDPLSYYTQRPEIYQNWTIDVASDDVVERYELRQDGQWLNIETQASISWPSNVYGKAYRLCDQMGVDQHWNLCGFYPITTIDPTNDTIATISLTINNEAIQLNIFGNTLDADITNASDALTDWVEHTRLPLDGCYINETELPIVVKLFVDGRQHDGLLAPANTTDDGTMDSTPLESFAALGNTTIAPRRSLLFSSDVHVRKHHALALLPGTTRVMIDECRFLMTR